MAADAPKARATAKPKALPKCVIQSPFTKKARQMLLRLSHGRQGIRCLPQQVAKSMCHPRDAIQVRQGRLSRITNYKEVSF